MGIKWVNDKTEYLLMHMDRKVLQFSFDGKIKVINKKFMPYGLYVENSNEIEVRTNNVLNIINWLARRVITIDRKYSKIIYNYLDLPQNNDDKTKAKFSILYHSLCLTDVYWVKSIDERVLFKDINLYDNSLSNAYVDIFLKGKGVTVNKKDFDTRDISTSGQCPKAWVRKKNSGFELYKDGNANEVNNEILASKIIECFNVNAVRYKKGTYSNKNVSICKIITNKKFSILNKFDFEIYCMNQNIDFYEYILKIDSYNYYMMNIIDYLIGNDDRHPNNWGVLINNNKNEILQLYSLMDFNKAFKNYRVKDAICLTTKERITQREAAIDAVKHIGLNLKKDINKSIFKGNESRYKEFMKRFNELKSIKK